ncbi:peptide deformylase [Wenyingzhuangia sp. chi5]|uniref:Peptide deformylase n=1 Tax=Wenyingzhuangia gilva TaxID=3057677 RepID=A0ABT8VNC1_9FLAO|nr:peptide deformylase [Wenyingzhuangia sp. chi5]MDO3693463.1 peptide deformylase [Wenyingzhuangia sp. chi5]
MILPIIAYGDPVLRKVGKEIDQDYPELSTLIANMWETMENANGVGLAAPQIGKSIRLFVIDATPFAEDEDLEEGEKEVLQNFRKVFINAKIESEEGDEWAFEEGCLSIPEIREEIWRNETIHVTYQDENFKTHKATYSGLAARVFQHEYDHIEGVLFTDKVSSLKKRLLKKKLENISKGKTGADYRMRYYSAKRR